MPKSSLTSDKIQLDTLYQIARKLGTKNFKLIKMPLLSMTYIVIGAGLDLNSWGRGYINHPLFNSFLSILTDFEICELAEV